MLRGGQENGGHTDRVQEIQTVSPFYLELDFMNSIEYGHWQTVVETYYCR